MQTPGKVWIVGAGPGDAELLTRKAHRLLGQAHAIVYDRLVSEEILALANPDAERIYAGKSCKDKAMTQEEIHEALARLAEQGMQVVRLKGGDPMLFGRGGEEAHYLARRGIDFEIVPGITTAQAVSALLALPFTQRGVATGVRFMTGHRMAEADTDPTPLNWESMADNDTTLVVYMGLTHLQEICNNLIDNGLLPDTPAVAVENATLPGQREVYGTLLTLPDKIREQGFEPPALIVIGRVAGL